MADTGPVPKLTGGDVELGNFILGRDHGARRTDYEASRRLLACIDGLPLSTEFADYRFAGYAQASADDPGSHPGAHNQDSGRRYRPDNGGCCYIDLNHLELATPEVTSARQYQAVWSAMLRSARRAQQDANALLPEPERIVVLASNSDRQGKSWGGHQNFMVSRRAWDDMMRRQMYPSLFYLMAYQASSIVFTGQGKAGSENGQPWVPFQISQRADFIETLLSIETMHHRPLVNTRDEALCGPERAHGRGQRPADRYARLHVIFYDTNLAPVATFLKVGVMQLILTMIEDRCIDARLLLDKPLAALHAWSQDPDLEARGTTTGGWRLNAVELQLKFLEQARRYQRTRGFDAYVPDADRIIALWEDVLLKLKARDFAALRGRIDWITRRALLEQALAGHPEWDWHSPEIAHLDQLYASIDPADGLFLALDAAGLVEAVASESEIARYVDSPPEDTRAWTRAMLLRALDPERIVHVDWDRILLRGAHGAGRVRIELPDPLGATRAQTEAAFAGPGDSADLLRRLRQHGIASTITSLSYPGATAYPLATTPLPNYRQPNRGDHHE